MRIKKLPNTIIKNSGFSLIELLIAMSVLALGMLAAASMQYSAVRNNTTGNTSTQATMLAKATLEMLKSEDIDSAILTVGDYADPSPVDLRSPATLLGLSWPWKYQFRSLRNTSQPL